MQLQQEFRPTKDLSKGKLEVEINEILNDPARSADLLNAGITDADAEAIHPDNFTVEQKAGIGIEAIVLTFSSKVAYDIWKEFILPRLKRKYGGSALMPIHPPRKHD